MNLQGVGPSDNKPSPLSEESSLQVSTKDGWYDLNKNQQSCFLGGSLLKDFRSASTTYLPNHMHLY